MTTTRVDLIRALLERWQELNEPQRSGNGTGPGLTLMPHEPHCRLLASQNRHCTCYRQSVDELERLLRQMRDGNENLRNARRQLVERFIKCEHRIATVERPSIDKHGRIRRVRGNVVHERVRVVVTSFDARVDPDVVKDGILWLAWNWRGPGPSLPRSWT